MSSVIFQETTLSTDHQTGEIMSSQTNQIIRERIPAEPPFVKVYIQDICALNNVPKSQQDVLYYLIQKLDYEGFITLSTRYRNLICEYLKIKPQTLSNKIQSLMKTGLIKVVGRNEYEVNPFFFGRGLWVDIYNNRQKGKFSMTIKYSQNGDREFSTSVVDE